MFLRDEELHQLLDPPSTIIVGLDPNRVTDSKEDPVQPASVDLTIGGVFVPGTPEGKRGSAGHPKQFLSLDPGETAVVETAQTCNLPADIGAIGFPPAAVSANGLLTTNPGHIDPGYHGTLSFTVINMGSEPYELRSGEDIVTLLIFRLSGDARSPYNARRPGLQGAVTDGRLDRLSHDFLDVSARARRAAEASERKTRALGLGVPIVVALVALAGVYYQASQAHEDQIKKLQQDVSNLQVTLDVENRFASLERLALEKRIARRERRR